MMNLKRPRFWYHIFNFIISLFIIQWTLSGCAPYSLPEKKTYSEKDDPYIYYAQSLEYYEANDYQSALQNIDIALRLNSNLAQFYLLKGDIHKALSESEKAIEAYETAIIKRSNFIEAHLSLADLYENMKLYEEAIRYYKKATVLESERIEILLKIVNCYIQLNEMAVADHFLNNYQRFATEMQRPVSDRYHALRGEVLFLMNKFEESLKVLNQVSQKDSLILYLYGKNYYALEDYSTGVTYFNQLLKEDKDNGSWYYYRGIYFYQQNDIEDAKGQFQYSLDLDSTLAEPHYYLGKIFLSEDNKSAALEEFKIYLQYDVQKGKAEEVNEIIQSLSTTSD